MNKPRNMKTALYVFWSLKIFRVYKDGDGYGYLIRWWNPLSWLYVVLVVLAVMAYVYMCGIPEIVEEHASDLGLRMDPYFVKYPEKLEWL